MTTDVITPGVEADHPLRALRAFIQSARAEGADERCAMCAIPIPSQHRHLVDTADRTIKCMCPHCHLLFSEPGAAAGRYRHIPTRHRQIEGFDVTDAEWDDLQIPVALAFFFRNSEQDRVVAFYPGPAGATESLLPLDAWARITARHPDLDEIEPDVEAVIVRRGAARSAAFIVPIDRCYELTGRLRMHWSGFDGGREAAAAIDDFFHDVKARSSA